MKEEKCQKPGWPTEPSSRVVAEQAIARSKEPGKYSGVETECAKPGSLHPVVRCWCRACRQDKNENEMFAGIIHPDGIGRGICIQCHQTGKDMERWKRLDEQTAPNEKLSHAGPAASTAKAD